MNETTNIEHHASCEPLLELATPHLYRHNLFRVLGQTVSATPQDVQRQQARRKMQEKYGLATSNGSGSPISLDPAPDDDAVRLAVERLNRPTDRILDEIFWFWPTERDSASDPALKALEQGDIERAAHIWGGQAKTMGNGHVAVHNLAILDHLVALDHETRLATSSLNKQEQERLPDLWLRGFARWKEVIEGEDFWSAVKGRIHELNDAQLTTGFVRRVRETLPLALLLISAKSAYSAAERSDSATAQRHLRLLREANFGDGLADQAIREAIKPLRNRVSTATDTAKSRWTSEPHRGNRHVRDLHGQAKGLLTVVDSILPADHVARSGLHDMVAEAMLDGQIDFGKKTNDWTECINLLKLAQEIASGGTVRSRLSENIEILQENAKAANDWCSPGYWELHQEIIAELEAARAKANAGDYDGAIHALMRLDPKIGQPLRRCLAYCLSLWGIRRANEANTEYNAETGVLKKIMDKLRAAKETSDSLLSIILMRRPDPNSSAFMNPPCLSCGRTGYTSWVNFTYRDIPLFMCSTCNEMHESEIKQQKGTLRGHVSTALEYLLLANEVDPDDAGVRRNIEALKKTARNVDCSLPKTKALKEKLGAQKTRSTRLTFDSAPENDICSFCAENSSDDSCQITVPMCGDLQPVDFLFNKGIAYRYADVVIPRCRRCRDEHRELPGRIEKWDEARLAVSADEHFLKETQQVIAAAKAAHDADATVEQSKRAVAEAQSGVKKAEATGEQCDQCGSSDCWRKSLCRRCDSTVFRLDTMSRFGIAATTLVSFAGVFFLDTLGVLSSLADFVAVTMSWTADSARRFVPLLIGGTIPLFVGGTLAGRLKQVQRRQRRELREQRQVEIQQRRAVAVAEATKPLVRADAALKAAEQVAQKRTKAHEETKKNLQTAKDKAVAKFDRTQPMPTMTTGIKPESAYVEFSRVKELRERGWGFGHEVRENNQSGSDHPVNVTGLVAHEPRPATHRVVTA